LPTSHLIMATVLQTASGDRTHIEIVSTSIEMPIVKCTVCVVSDHLNSVHFTIGFLPPAFSPQASHPPTRPHY
jgi:hypothetical protein